MKYLPPIAGVLLGLLFVASGMVVLLKLVTIPAEAAGSPAAHFMSALGPTGYMSFIKVLEVLGGVLVAVPRTRRLGLLVLGPIIVNILAYHLFVMAGKGLFQPPLLILVALATYLLWVERKAFLALAIGDRR